MSRLIAALFASVFLLSACGGGGGGGAAASAAPSGFAQTYTASATAGELLTYSIDTNALTYSYTITKSSYGCDVSSAPCHTGSGTLVKNSDGTFSPSTDSSTKIFALQDGLLVGSVHLTLNGVSLRVPIIGISNPITTAANLAGTYNNMALQCSARTYGLFTGCATSQGTISVTANATYTTCAGGNLGATVHTCTNTTSGTLTSLGGGVWSLQSTSPTTGSSLNYFLAFTAPNGQKVAFIDLNDPIVYGYGTAVASTTVATSGADIAGTYLALNDYGGAGVVTINSNDTTSNNKTIVENSPWSGIATVSGGGIGNGYGMFAGNGVYVYRNPNVPGEAAYFEIGLRVQ